jgi:hypothetical protein
MVIYQYCCGKYNTHVKFSPNELFLLTASITFEELFFRGLLRSFFETISVPYPCEIVTVLFAAVHLVNSSVSADIGTRKLTMNAAVIVPQVIVSLILGKFFYELDNLFYATVTHLIWNALVYIPTTLQSSPEQTKVNVDINIVIPVLKRNRSTDSFFSDLVPKSKTRGFITCKANKRSEIKFEKFTQKPKV